MKNKLIKIITISLKSEQVGHFINSEEMDHKLYHEIINIGRVGNPEMKESALACIASLVKCCDKDRAQYFIDYFQIL